MYRKPCILHTCKYGRDKIACRHANGGGIESIIPTPPQNHSMHHTFTYQTTTTKKTIHLDIPDTLSVETIKQSTSDIPAPADMDLTVPVTIDPHKRTLIIVNDGQRPTPTARILAKLSDPIASNENCSFIIATC